MKSKTWHHLGGIFIEAMSVYYIDKSGIDLQNNCISETKWVYNQLNKSNKIY